MTDSASENTENVKVPIAHLSPEAIMLCWFYSQTMLSICEQKPSDATQCCESQSEVNQKPVKLS